MGSGVAIVLEFIVLGISKMDPGIDLMIGGDLLLVGDEVAPLKGIPCQGGAGHGELDSEIHLNGGVDHGVVAEDFLLPVGVLGISSNSDLGVEIRGELRAAEVEGVVGSHEDDLGEYPSFDSDIEAGVPELILETEDAVEGVVRIGIGLLKCEHEDLHLGPWLIGRKAGRGAFDLDAHLLSQNQPGRIPESAKHPPADVVDDALKGDGVTLSAEVGAALVAGVGGKEGAVGGDDLVGEKAQKLDDSDQDMEDAVVEVLSQSGLEVGEGCLAGDMTVADARIDPIVFSSDRIIEQLAEGLEVAELLQMAEELKEKEADRVVGHTHQAVLVGHNGTKEGEVDKGRDHAGEAPDDPSAGIDLDVSTLVAVIGEQKAVRLGKRFRVFGVDGNRNGVELFDHVANGERRQISQLAVPFLEVIHIKEDLLKGPVR